MLPSAPPSFSGDGQRASARVSPNLVLQSKSARVRVRGYDHRKRNREVRREAREGTRCAEVRANWRSGAAQNQLEKHEKVGAIEGEKEGDR